MVVLPKSRAPVALGSILAGLIALSLLALPLSTNASARWRGSLDGLALEAIRADLQLTAARVDVDFWRTWQQTDRAVVKLFHKDPAFVEAVRFQDPGHLVDAYPMLLNALTTNARWLRTLGRYADAHRVQRAAARIANFAATDETLWSTLILNTLSRFLLAGWRDVDDPLSVLEFQVHQALANAEQLRARVKGASAPPKVPLWRAALQATLLRPLPPWWPAHAATILLPVPADALLAPLLVAGPPARAATAVGDHNPLLDDLSYALNLPFGLAPPGTPVTRHLSQLPPNLPSGNALLLGAGDGAEALAVAATGRFSRVTVVEHSPLAVVRTWQLASRLRRWLRDRSISTDIEALEADVVDYLPTPGSCSLVLAIHLLEYLPADERRQLYDSLQGALQPGGEVVLSVHLARGPRYQALTSEYANVLREAASDGVRITLSQMVPAHPTAVQVQTFFHEQHLRAELERAFPPGRFDSRTAIESTPAGFTECTTVLTRK